MTKQWPVAALPLGEVAVGTMLWRHQGCLYVTVAVKASYELVADGRMRPAEPSELSAQEQWDGMQMVHAQEMVPLLLQAEVVVVADVHPPPGGVSEAVVSLGATRGNRTLLNKSLKVFGDRRAGEPAAAIARMPLSYNHALGCADNPLGIGNGASAGRLPNIVDPHDPTGKVAGVAPIPARLPMRSKLLSAAARAQVGQEVMDLPVDFDWSYFQSAPADQQLAQLYGDEWLFLGGMHAEHPTLRVQLPGSAAHCRIYGGGGAGLPERLQLSLDMVHVLVRDMRASIVWRGKAQVRDEGALEQVVVAGAVAPFGATVAFPATPDALRRKGGGGTAPPPRAAGAAGPRKRLTATLRKPASPHTGAPFTMAQPSDAAAAQAPTTPGAPWSKEKARKVRPPTAGGGGGEHPFETTVGLDEVTRVDDRPTPFAAVKPAQQEPPAVESQSFEGTVVLTDDDELVGASAVAPFPIATAEGEPPVAVGAVPGAPWSDEPAPLWPMKPGEFFETSMGLSTPAPVTAPMDARPPARVTEPVRVQAQQQPAREADESRQQQEREALAQRQVEERARVQREAEEQARQAREQEEALARREAEEQERMRREDEEALARREAEEQERMRREEEEARREAEEEARRRREQEQARFVAEQEQVKRKQEEQRQQARQERRQHRKSLRRGLYKSFEPKS